MLRIREDMLAAGMVIYGNGLDICTDEAAASLLCADAHDLTEFLGSCDDVRADRAKRFCQKCTSKRIPMNFESKVRV